MITFTDLARERILRFLAEQHSQGVCALRLAGDRAEQKLWLVKESDRQPGDRIFDAGGFEVYLDPFSAGQLTGTTVDFIEDLMQSGFRVIFPAPHWDDPLARRVQEVIDTVIAPGVASHGGSVSLVRIEGQTAFISFGGGCQGCGAASVTLKQGVERLLKEGVPEIRRVVDTTDHASGENPYFGSGDTGDSPLT